jgi:RNA polymerase sigma-70 factor (ECF subfamily)
MYEELAEHTDEELAAQVQKGSEAALAVLIERYEAKLMRYGQRFLGYQSTDSLRESVQDVFIAVYQNIESFDPKQRFSPWIYRIAHNAFVDVLRHKTRQPLYVFDFDKILPHAINTSHEDISRKEKENAEARVLLEKGLDLLSAQQREILVLYYFEDLSYKEIADVLHVPVSTVGVRLARARTMLKKKLPDDPAMMPFT